MAEVGFETLARIVVERDERLPVDPTLGTQITTNPVIAARVSMLVAQTAKDLGRRVALLPRRLFIGTDQRVDDRFEKIQDRRSWPALIRLGLGMSKDLADFVPRMMELASQLPNAQLVVSVGLSDTCIFVHCDHPPPPCSWSPARATSVQEVAGGGSVFDKHFLPGWARIGRALPLGSAGGLMS